MMMRVKLVTVSIMAGASDRMVRRKRISNRTDTFSGSDCPAPSERERDGTARSRAANAATGTSKNNVLRVRIRTVELSHNFCKFFRVRGVARVIFRFRFR